jgi:hypothetical protein
VARGAEGLEQQLFAEVSEQLEAPGPMLKRGTLIDASLVDAAVSKKRWTGTG